MRLAGLTTFCCAALFSACATGYKPESPIGVGGYSETKRTPDVWRVWFVGNAQTSMDRGEDLALLRGAELCLAEKKPFIRAGNINSNPEFTGHFQERVTRIHSTVEVTCLVEKSGDAQDAAAVAADIRRRYRIAAPRPAS